MILIEPEFDPSVANKPEGATRFAVQLEAVTDQAPELQEAVAEPLAPGLELVRDIEFPESVAAAEAAQELDAPQFKVVAGHVLTTSQNEIVSPDWIAENCRAEYIKLQLVSVDEATEVPTFAALPVL